MPKPASELADRLNRRFRSLELTRAKIEILRNALSLSMRDVELVYEGLFLSAHSAFENFIEDLFVGLLLKGKRSVSRRRNIIPRIQVQSESIAYDLILGNRKKYVDWLPYKNTLEYAEIFFRGGRPFSELDEYQKDHLVKCLFVRNAIAHKSKYSLRKFEEEVIGNTPLVHREKTPSGYLRGIFRTTPPQTRYENMIAQLSQIAAKLAQ